jgi:hypothetical protein
MAEEEKGQIPNTLLPKGALASSDTQVRVRTERFQQVYANNVQIGFSSFDMALSFGQIVGDQDGKAVIEEMTRVIVTREIGKLLIGLLMANVANYEQQYGEIRIPTALLHGEDEPEEDADQPRAEIVE